MFPPVFRQSPGRMTASPAAWPIPVTANIAPGRLLLTLFERFLILVSHEGSGYFLLVSHEGSRCIAARFKTDHTIHLPGMNGLDNLEAALEKVLESPLRILEWRILSNHPQLWSGEGLEFLRAERARAREGKDFRRIAGLSSWLLLLERFENMLA